MTVDSGCLRENDLEGLLPLPSKFVYSFPNESDRKRIVGCIATIISTMYDYENQTHESPKNSSIFRKGNSAMNIFNINKNQTTLDRLLDNEILESINMTNKPHININQPRINDTLIFKSLKSSYLDYNRINSDKNLHIDRFVDLYFSGKSQNKNLYERCCCVCHSSSEYHHKRRYSVYSEFLLSTADLLFLDKSNAVAFLPLLNSLCDCYCETDVQIKNNTTEGSSGNILHNDSGSQLNLSSFKDISFKNTTVKNFSFITNPLGKYHWNHQTIHKTVNCTENPTSCRFFVPKYSVIDIRNSRMNKNNSQSIGLSNNDIYSSTMPVQSMLSFKHNNIFEIRRLNHNFQTWYNNDLLRPFVESLTKGSGFQCLCLLLLNYLLQSNKGYDARIRHVIKKLAVVVLVQEMIHDDYNRNLSNIYIIPSQYDMLISRASRKFEQLEHVIAGKLINISRLQPDTKSNCKPNNQTLSVLKTVTNRKNFFRGLKIGSAGVIGGTLFAVTGGLAAPGITAGIAALGTATATTTSVMSSLTSTAAVTTIFGFGGGSLAAYKTHRRTRGVTEFEIEKESFTGKYKYKHENEVSGLFSTVCLSGWLRDMRDFQRPWGVIPRHPCMDRGEKLFRFYTVFNPQNLNRTDEILRKWRGKEKMLWKVLRKKYGRDPDHIYPLKYGPSYSEILTQDEEKVINNLLRYLGFHIPLETSICRPDNEAFRSAPEHQISYKSQKKTMKFMNDKYENPNNFLPGAICSYYSDLHRLHDNTSYLNKENYDSSSEFMRHQASEIPKRTKSINVWDYHAEYGGELYTVRWESALLMELCDSVTDMAVDLAGVAAKEILKQTVLATLITAIALPYALVNAANMIDGVWTLAIERADIVGIELAKSLLYSYAGNRPVALVGFSMGARAIYSCLKELAHHQSKWQNLQNRCENIVYLREPASIVEDAILMGTPNHISIPSWKACRGVVAGRLVNCYSQKDLILSVMFQFKRLAGGLLRPVTGSSPVNVNGVENFDVGHLINTHSDYCVYAGNILRYVRHGQPYRPSFTLLEPKT